MKISLITIECHSNGDNFRFYRLLVLPLIDLIPEHVVVRQFGPGPRQHEQRCIDFLDEFHRAVREGLGNAHNPFRVMARICGRGLGLRDPETPCFLVARQWSRIRNDDTVVASGNESGESDERVEVGSRWPNIDEDAVAEGSLERRGSRNTPDEELCAERCREGGSLRGDPTDRGQHRGHRRASAQGDEPVALTR